MRRLRIAASIGGTVALFLWMANRQPVRFGPLIGMLIALLVVWGWTGGLEEGRRATSTDRMDWLRPAFFTLLLVAAVYLPSLGQGLWDPWETHYAEVAREILSRNDWISLWWAQDKWFWSKPVLVFWMEALSIGALGFNFAPDGNPIGIEWAVRLPHVLLAGMALFTLFGTVRKVFSLRAAVITVFVVATTPQFFLIAHQAITDLPLVALTMCAMCMLILAIGESPQSEAGVFRIGRMRISPSAVAVGVVVALVLPQALYLVSRNVALDLTGDPWISFPRDAFLYGSIGNSVVPGNPASSLHGPYVPGMAGQPALQGALWLSLLALFVLAVRHERRTQRLYMILFYVFCALAFLAKGLPGIAIPGAVALLYLIASQRWALLFEGRFSIGLGVAVVSLVSLPWYVAMYVRHGPSFTNRLLIHDHINRLASGVHGDTGSIQYFIEQMGFALFPWIGLVPVAGLVVAKAARSARETRGTTANAHAAQTTLLLAIWFATAFTLFSAMATKFHHYILPAVVPISVLVGLAVSERWGKRNWRATSFALAGTAMAIAAVAAMARKWLGHAGAEPGSSDNGVGIALAVVLGLVACLFLALAQRSLSIEGLRGPARTVRLPVAFGVGAGLLALVGRDLSWVTSARPQGYERLVQLFVYNYARPWPDIDYSAPLIGFAVCGGVFIALCVFARTRRLGIRAIAAVALVFTVWSLNVYLPELAPHWSQRDLVHRYYALRQGPEEPLLAWQMNWKGENFYTGNRAHVFAEVDNKPIKKWIAAHPGESAYVILEHTRLSNFKRLVDEDEMHVLSSKTENNKYLLVRVNL